MTMAVTYGTFCGQTVHEERGGVERVYVPDTLGSTAMLTDTSGNVTDAFAYWPYGEERSRTGTTPTPFTFVGTLGYYRDAAARLYVRARTLLSGLARWMTVDPLWPMEMAYGYVHNSPVRSTDPSGLMFGYGNYCGARNGNGGTQTPINGVDRCCQTHDSCLARLCDWLNPIKEKQCDCTLCACVSANIGNCGWDLKCWCGALAVKNYACNSCFGNPISSLIHTIPMNPIATGCYIWG